jgi:hypothetical protein
VKFVYVAEDVGKQRWIFESDVKNVARDWKTLSNEELRSV